MSRKEREAEKVNRMVKWYLATSAEMRRRKRGQTMTEYALILAAVAIVAYVTYQVMGQDIGSMVATIDNALAAA
jgi:Flp pilus assembly pilin Flp